MRSFTCTWEGPQFSSKKPIVPESGWRKPSSISSVVVFPAPFGPRMARISPSMSSMLTSSTALVPA